MLINGAKLGLGEAQQACADLLREALSEAEAGNIHSVGIILGMKDGYAAVMAGYGAADLNLGCDSLKKKIIEAIEEDGNVRKQQRSSIMRVS